MRISLMASNSKIRRLAKLCQVTIISSNIPLKPIRHKQELRLSRPKCKLKLKHEIREVGYLMEGRQVQQLQVATHNKPQFCLSKI